MAFCSEFYYTFQLKYVFRLEENVSRAMGQNSLTLGKQEHELSTRMWSGRAPWNRGKFASQSAWYQKAIEVGQRFSLRHSLIKKAICNSAKT